MSFRLAFASIPIAIAITVVGCDPGFTYLPVDPKGASLSKGSVRIRGVEFSMIPYHVLVGSGSSFVPLQIDNGSDFPVEVIDASLDSKGHVIAATIGTDAASRMQRTVQAKSSKTIYVNWEFSDSASDTLGNDLNWLWTLRIGDEKHKIDFPMHRQ